MRISDSIKAQYFRHDFRGLLKEILFEYRRILHGKMLDLYNRPLNPADYAHAGTYFVYRYGFSLTVGDLGALESNFEAHATTLWEKFQSLPSVSK